MTQAIVFSKDRALQLEALLTSFFRKASRVNQLELLVIYDASSPRLLHQYDTLARDFTMRVRFLREGQFRESLLAELRRGANPRSSGMATGLPGGLRRPRSTATDAADETGGCILFLVDDAILVRPFDLAALQSALRAHPEAVGFSLRLGTNTIESYAMSRPQAMPVFRAASDGFLSYDWTTADGDFGYPLELSSSMYRLADLLPILAKLQFQNPNSLESMLSLQAKRLAPKRPAMLCPEVSVAFSAPVNRVQGVFENRSGTDPKWSTERLADMFEQGLRIDVARFDNFTPSACHQEVEFSFELRR